MKILIKGIPIDTDNISSIREIDDGQSFFSDVEYTYCFYIDFYREKSMVIEHSFRFRDINRSEFFQDEQMMKQIKQLKLDTKNELIDLRNRIVEIWKNNPSKAPNFDIIKNID